MLLAVTEEEKVAAPVEAIESLVKPDVLKLIVSGTLEAEP
jgi:hypothetical protein